MNILVTGSNGQLGNELRSIAAQYKDCTFSFTDIEELDITHAESVYSIVRQKKIRLIINCAAYTAVDKAESNHPLAHRLNAEAPAYLAKAMMECGGEIIHISTDYVFDGTSHLPYTEDMPTNPDSVYGATKLEGEKAVLSNCPNSIIIRTAWLYSCHGNNFVKTMIRLGQECQRLNVVFDQIGSPTYAHDLALAIMKIATTPTKQYGIFHFSNEGAISWYDFTKAIHRIAAVDNCEVLPIRSYDYPTAAKRPAYSVLDKHKIKSVYQVQVPYWEDSLEACIQKLTNDANQ